MQGDRGAATSARGRQGQSTLLRRNPKTRKQMAEMMDNLNRMMKRMGSMADMDMKPKSRAHKTRRLDAAGKRLERLSMMRSVQSTLTQAV